jgi:hypothetical protein
MIRRCLTPDRDHREGTSPMAADPIAHPAAAGVVELGYRRMRIGAGADDDYGNAAPMEITERFPQPLGNLAQNARFPHSHSRFSHVDQNKDQNTNPIRGPVPRSKGGARLSAGCRTR